MTKDTIETANCDCGAVDDGRWAGVHSPNCASILRREENINEALADALALILPMAKGYAHQNRVGSNAEKIEMAEAVLAKVQS